MHPVFLEKLNLNEIPQPTDLIINVSGCPILFPFVCFFFFPADVEQSESKHVKIRTNLPSK